MDVLLLELDTEQHRVEEVAQNVDTLDNIAKVLLSLGNGTVADEEFHFLCNDNTCDARSEISVRVEQEFGRVNRSK